MGAALALAILACALPVVRAFGAASGPGSAAARTKPALHTGGELRIAMPDASLTVDPALVADEQNAQLAGMMYQGLVRLDAHYRVQPGAATFSIGRDRRTYTFHLKRGLRFSNGDPVTASDFAFSINRSLDPAVRSPSAPTYLLDIQGARAVLAGKAKEASG